MTFGILLAAIAIAAIPAVLFRIWKSHRKVVYQGTASVITGRLEHLGARTNTKYCWMEVQGRRFLTQLSPERYAKVRASSDPATITVVKYPLCEAEVESVRWMGETDNEPTIKLGFAALLVCLMYFIGGMGAMALGFAHHAEAVGQQAVYVSALLFVLSGFSVTLMRSGTRDLSQMSGTMLGIPIGKGLTPLVVILAVSLVGTYFCFGSISFFTFFPGIHAAMGVGSMIALWWTTRQTK